MAEEKITIVDIRKAIARQMSLPNETAGKFLNALFPAIIDGLKRDKMVRISGLGCFKLVWVEPRRSVNVTTGESILLDGYNKLTFIPDSYIREQINEPYAGLEAVRVDANGQPMEPQSTLPGLDPRIRFGEQAQEIVGLLADLGQDVNQVPQEQNDTLDEEPTPKDESVNEQSDTSQEDESAEEPLEYLTEELLPIVEDVSEQHSPDIQSGTSTSEAYSNTDTPVETESQDSTEETKVPHEEPDVETVQPNKTEEPKAPSNDLGPFFESKKEETDNKGFNGWIVAIFTIVVLMIMLVVGYFILVDKLEKWANSLGMEETVTTEEQLDEISEDTIGMLAIEPLQPLDSTIADSCTTFEEEAPVAIKSTTSTAPVSEQNMDILSIETVKKGSRLTLIALKHYGKKDLWVYIYEANRDVIKDPSKLTTGTKLKIPRLSDDILNMSSEELKVLHDKYIQ